MNRVRFQPPGFTRGERIGTIFEIYHDALYGTTYYVEDEQGTKYQLSPGAILAPEQVGDR